MCYYSLSLSLPKIFIWLGNKHGYLATTRERIIIFSSVVMISKFPLAVGFGMFKKKGSFDFLDKSIKRPVFVITGYREDVAAAKHLGTFQSDPCRLPRRPSHVAVGSMGGCPVDRTPAAR